MTQRNATRGTGVCLANLAFNFASQRPVEPPRVTFTPHDNAIYEARWRVDDELVVSRVLPVSVAWPLIHSRLLAPETTLSPSRTSRPRKLQRVSSGTRVG